MNLSAPALGALVAAAVSLFGFESGAALSTVLRMGNASKGWREAGSRA